MGSRYKYKTRKKEGTVKELKEVERKLGILEAKTVPWREKAVKRGKNEAMRKKILGEE